MEHKSVQNEKFVGSRMRINSGDSTIEMFVGLGNAVRQQLSAGNPMQASSQAEVLTAKIERQLRKARDRFDRWQTIERHGTASKVVSPEALSERRLPGYVAPPFSATQVAPPLPEEVEGLEPPETVQQLKEPAIVIDDDGALVEFALSGSVLKELEGDV